MLHQGFHRQHCPYPQGCLTTGRRARDLWSIPRCLCHSRVTDGRVSTTEANQPDLR
ncbi:MAG: hypothetical protein ACFFCS_24820 [Candidatus Hodarchaeota archaeon]